MLVQMLRGRANGGGGAAAVLAELSQGELLALASAAMEPGQVGGPGAEA